MPAAAGFPRSANRAERSLTKDADGGPRTTTASGGTVDAGLKTPSAMRGSMAGDVSPPRRKRANDSTKAASTSCVFSKNTGVTRAPRMRRRSCVAAAFPESCRWTNTVTVRSRKASPSHSTATCVHASS